MMTESNLIRFPNRPARGESTESWFRRSWTFKGFSGPRPADSGREVQHLLVLDGGRRPTAPKRSTRARRSTTDKRRRAR
jgi:hypothetical protein